MIQSITYSGFIKRAFSTKSLATNAKKLSEEILLDPEVSGIDLVVLSPRDIQGIQGKDLLNAVNNKHSKVRVVYLFTKDKENIDFDTEVRCVQTKKVTTEVLTEAINTTLQGLEISDHEIAIVSQDHNPQKLASSKEKLGGFFSRGKGRASLPNRPVKRKGNESELIDHEKNPRKKGIQNEEVEEDEYEIEDRRQAPKELPVEPIEAPELPPMDDLPSLDPGRPSLEPAPDVLSIDSTQAAQLSQDMAGQQQPAASTGYVIATPIEERVKGVQRYEDWEAFKHHLKRDQVLRELAHESTQFAGALNMLEVLDRQIYHVFSDNSRTYEDKMREIRELALNRSAIKDQQNNLIVAKLGAIMDAIVTTIENTVEQRISSLKRQFDEVSNVNLYAQDRSRIQSLIEERLVIQTELHEVTMGLLNTYKLLDDTVSEAVDKIDEGLPTDNAYINEVFKPLGQIFTPKSAGELTTKLLNYLSNHRESLTALEVKLKEVVMLVYRLCDMDTKIIDYQAQHIRLLEANRIEDVIITDTMLKTALRLFVGLDGTGLHATALTISGVQSRQRNTLLIDLSGNNHFDDYSTPYITLDAFRATKTQNAFLCVNGEVKDGLDLRELIGTLNEVVAYYPNIHVILNSEQKEYLDILGETAISINYVCNSSKESVYEMANVVRNFTAKNVARKAVLIDSDDPLWLLGELNLDPLTTKLVSIPHITKMKTYSLKGLPPHQDSEIAEVFEMAFK